MQGSRYLLKGMKASNHQKFSNRCLDNVVDYGCLERRNESLKFKNWRSILG